ncbi:MAG: hypothetical protein K2P78_04105 [Gemmataceae bacterium]|nr:hypothetical protein [Gemmataceae bacterium]
MQSVFLALPHNGVLSPEAVPGLSAPMARGALCRAMVKGSVLTRVFNELWCHALNARSESRLTHFAMHHSDIAAPPGWLDALVDEAERVGADVLSAVVPLKDPRGLTSTAVLAPGGGVRRLTLTEVRQLPPTFSAADIDSGGGLTLLVNTGLWVCRFTEPWVEEVAFSNVDWIARGPAGEFRPVSLSEDWNFSRWAAGRMLRVFATSKVPVTHYGHHGFMSHGPAGEWESDRGEPA